MILKEKKKVSEQEADLVSEAWLNSDTSSSVLA